MESQHHDRDLAHPVQHAADQVARTLGFWSRVTGIYASYKLTQLQAALQRMQGTSAQVIKDTIWTPRHETAGRQIYQMCVDLRGFYLKVRFVCCVLCVCVGGWVLYSVRGVAVHNVMIIVLIYAHTHAPVCTNTHTYRQGSLWVLEGTLYLVNGVNISASCMIR